ncbi:MAG TPA: DUF3800 domain-containing protein [Actinomycetota bacterium]|nr:DUF3800 domain-containing protein [Actinomycetota bacterium]
MAFRIYVDESGTHSDDWLVIGMLFVPQHGRLHSDLCRVKEEQAYFNRSTKRKARFKETHLTEFRSPRDVAIAKRWLDLFIKHNCYFRCIVIDWSIWDGSHFGTPFEPSALKKRRAYKKWAEMLLHPELKEPLYGGSIRGAQLYLDRLRILYGYDVIDHLKDRFTRNYEGASPYIATFQHTESWKDANQCLQLCDLLTGCMYQVLNPAKSSVKQETWRYLGDLLRSQGVERLDPGFWRQYESGSVRKHFPKFSAWFWRPTPQGRARRARKRR